MFFIRLLRRLRASVVWLYWPFFLVSLTLLLRTTASAQSPDGGTNSPVVGKDSGTSKRPTLHVTRFPQPPVVDGHLDDVVWQNAAVCNNFLQTQPGDNTTASQPTEVRIGYDAKFLYLGIHAVHHSEQIRATVAKRDDLSGNDYVAVWLDTFNDQRRAYVLLFNPLGVQADGIFTEGQGIDWSVDVVMQSRGTITEDGYVIEASIPFASLRYEAGKGKFWGLHLIRSVRHLDEWDTWMPLRRESRNFSTSTFIRFLEQAGTLTGIEDIGRERTLELIPTVTVSENGKRVRSLPHALT